MDVDVHLCFYFKQGSAPMAAHMVHVGVGRLSHYDTVIYNFFWNIQPDHTMNKSYKDSEFKLRFL